MVSQKGHKLARKSKSETNVVKTNGGIAELMKELWQAAVTLRGSIEPADYKRYVLPIIFLRFLSLRYQARRADLERKVAEPTSEYYKDTKALDDPDEYRAVGAFIVPEKARWDLLRSVAQADDVKLRVDEALEALENAYPDRLKGLLPRIYADSNMNADSLRGLINLFSKDIFTYDHGGEDVLGRVYEYFIGEFANSEGKRGGEYFTPASIVKTLVAMLEPNEGSVFDPCCGSGGMFVQSDKFTKHSHRLSFFGQESKDFTLRLARMNLFIHGVDGKIELGNSYTDDRFAGQRFDYILANPPFNDGAKGENGWGASGVPAEDPRRQQFGFKDERGHPTGAPLSPRNANTMWMMHFLHHLAEGGTAGFVMATGELSNGEVARVAVRKALIESGYVDCLVQLSGQLFANTQIPCCLWFLSKNRNGETGFRARRDEILFIDGRKLGALIPGSRKQKQLTDEEIERIAGIYRTFKRSGSPEAIAGFCRAATLDEVRGHNYAVAPGRFVGSDIAGDDEEEFEQAFTRLKTVLMHQLDQSAQLSHQIRSVLDGIVDA